MAIYADFKSDLLIEFVWMIDLFFHKQKQGTNLNVSDVSVVQIYSNVQMGHISEILKKSFFIGFYSFLVFFW